MTPVKHDLIKSRMANELNHSQLLYGKLLEIANSPEYSQDEKDAIRQYIVDAYLLLKAREEKQILSEISLKDDVENKKKLISDLFNIDPESLLPPEINL